MATAATSSRIDALRAILNDGMLTDREELQRALTEYLRDPLVAAVVAGAYVERSRLLLQAQAENEGMQDRMRKALGEIEDLQKKARKMRRENPKPLAVYLMSLGADQALVWIRGGLEPLEAGPAIAQQKPVPGTYCIVNDEGFLDAPTSLVQSQSPGVVRSVENGQVMVEVNGREHSAVVSEAVEGPLTAGDRVRVLETSGMAMITARNGKSTVTALNRYPRIVPWKGGFAGAAPLHPHLREAAMRRVVLPVRDPEAARKLNVELPALLFLFGPSRTGKTVCIRCLVAELNIPAFSISLSSIGSEYVTVTVRQLRQAVDQALLLSVEKNQPVLLVLDDGEQLARARGSYRGSSGFHDDVVSELLGLVDYLEQRSGPGRVCVAIISNREDLLDTAMVKRGGQQLRFNLPGPTEFAAVWRYELNLLDAAARPADPEAAVETLTADVFTDPAWVTDMLGEGALQLVSPANLIDCAVPRQALSEARGLALERAVRDGHVTPLCLDELRTCQKKILIDSYRLAIKRAADGRLSDLNLLSLRPRT
jgi:ATP-dependent 26S proteasome regulatory subunit